jgi:LysM repeat protein
MKNGGCVVLAVLLWVSPVWAMLEISPSFLGMYRKTMEIEKEMLAHTAHYGVDPRLARAVVIQESGGNAHLVSSAGARGYFQVMPATFRMLKVRTNIEAGIKYLAQMQKQFGREDYAIAAYNAGPGTISKDRPLRLETLQYVINVGHYKSVLRLHETEIRQQATALKLRQVQKGDSWESLARTTAIPHAVLRLYNPFLAPRPLQAGALIAYPQAVPPDLLEYDGDDIYYTSKLGDSYLNLALVFGVDFETFRRHNDLWRLQQLPAGVRLRVALSPESPFRQLQLALQPQSTAARSSSQPRTPSPERTAPPQQARVYKVQTGDTLEKIAHQHRTTVRALMQANGLRNAHIQAGATLQIPPAGSQQSASTQKRAPRQVRRYTVRRGDTLEAIARKHHTTVQALKRANDLRDSRIQAGASLRIPGNGNT